MANQRSSVKFLPPRAVIHACRHCSKSCEAEVVQGTSIMSKIDCSKKVKTGVKFSTGI